ncbi:MAG: CHAT domain-containing protein [Ignavibacteriaceae bacterium]|nr:CHAT domain-containing protein [Ignavibacteriaceae bacterium]
MRVVLIFAAAIFIFTSSELFSQVQDPAFVIKINEALEKASGGNPKGAEFDFLKIAEEAKLSGDIISAAQAFKQLGTLYSPQTFNIPDTSMMFYDRALSLIDDELASLTGKGKTPDVSFLKEKANILNNISILYQYSKDYSTAIEKFTEALEIDREINNPEGEISTLSNIGRAYRDQGLYTDDPDESEFSLSSSLLYFDSALTVAKMPELQKSAAIRVPEIYLNIARTYDIRLNYDSALIYYDKAAEIFGQSGNLRLEAITTLNKGYTLTKYSDIETDEKKKTQLLESGISLLKDGIEIIEKLRGEIESDLLRSTFFDDKILYYEILIERLFNAGMYEEVFEYIERAKSRAFLDQLASREENLSKYPKEVQDLIKKVKDLEDKIYELRSGRDAEAELAAVIKNYDEAVKQLAEAAPEYSALTTVQPVRVEDIRKQLGDQEAIIEYYTGRLFNCVLFISKKELTGRFIDVTSYSLEDTIHALRDQITEFPQEKVTFINLTLRKNKKNPNPPDSLQLEQMWAAEKTNSYFQWTLMQLFGVLVGKEIYTLSSAYERLFIVPHGILHHLPFAALIPSPAHLDFSQGRHIVHPRYWITEKALVTIPSASVLQFIRKREGREHNTALIIGNPVYPVSSWNDLQFAEKEAEFVSQFFEADEKLFLKKEQATETIVKENIGRYDIIHLATHGLFMQEALESRVLFSKTDKDDGYLKAKEIFDLSLKSSLVVLSACESGQVGGYVSGMAPAGDDLVGLTRAFLFAGSASVIATLWSVDDIATGEVMKTFYKNFIKSGMNKSDALRAAQLAVLDDPGHIDWQHPFYWAPFVLYGSYK